MLQHGIHLGQQAEMVTDSLRALLLEAEGYATQVFEFVALEHTSKNKMILAVKRRAQRRSGRDRWRRSARSRRSTGSASIASRPCWPAPRQPARATFRSRPDGGAAACRASLPAQPNRTGSLPCRLLRITTVLASLSCQPCLRRSKPTQIRPRQSGVVDTK